MVDSEREESNEAALVIRAQERDQHAFELLYDRYKGKINRYLTRMVGDDTASDELAQETFLKAWLNLPSLREPKLFISWLYRIARNRGLDHQRRRLPPETPLDAFAGGDEDILNGAGLEEGVAQRELIELALNQLPPIHRSCLMLYVIKGLSQREVAQRLNIKETSIGSYLSRGREEFRQNYYRLLSGQRSTPPKRRIGKADA
jgi:RNA polymerase sigma-70 factor (ECF subfamily)